MSGGADRVFAGARHRLVYRLVSGGPDAALLCVGFGDVEPEPGYGHEAELSVLPVHRLHVRDDFGPYVDEVGYPGSWMLGERRSLSLAQDVIALVEESRARLGVEASQVVACGAGKGGFAALHLALLAGWGHVIAHAPHVRLGAYLRDAGLDSILTFLAGGDGPADRRWLDGLLERAVRTGARPSVLVQAAVHDPVYADHVLPLLELLEPAGVPVTLELDEGRGFGAYLLEQVDDLAGARREPVPLDDPETAAGMRWNARSKPTITTTVTGGLRCLLPAAPTTEGPHYAGVSAAVDPFAALVVDLRVRRSTALESFYLDALDDRGTRLLRWQWWVEKEESPPSGAVSVVLRPGYPTGSFRAVGDTLEEQAQALAARVARVEVLARVTPGGRLDFTVDRLQAVPPVEDVEPLVADRYEAPRSGHLLAPEAEAALVRRLVGEQAFPPAAHFTDGPVVRPALTVATVLDEFSALGFGYEFRCVPLPPEGWEATLDQERPDVLLVESAWRGHEERWNHLVVDAHGEGPSEPLQLLVAECRRRGIPTVFWNKEDPPNFDVFVEPAGLFDYVFTTDEDCVPRYREQLGHDRVGVLPFAAQPRVHNPAGAPRARPLDVAFLGTFYGRKHPDRKRQMEMILDPARDFGVHIYSRTGDLRGYEFPAKYRGHVVGTVPYTRVVGAYRTYKVLLNVNSVVASRTMCARRVFEIVGCGGTVVSGPSPALEAVLGPGVVTECASHGEARDALAWVMENEDERRREAVRALRVVMAAHTYRHRVDHMLQTMGVATAAPAPAVSWIAVVDDDDSARRALDHAADQAMDGVELILALRGGLAPPLGADPGVRTVAVPDGVAAGEALALAVVQAGGTHVALMDPAAEYGPHFLTDLVHALSYTEATIVGKGAHHRWEDGRLVVARPADEEALVRDLLPEGCLIPRERLAGAALGEGDDVLDVVGRWLAERGAAGEPLYASDCFNLVTSPARAARETGAAVRRLPAGTAVEAAFV